MLKPQPWEENSYHWPTIRAVNTGYICKFNMCCSILTVIVSLPWNTNSFSYLFGEHTWKYKETVVANFLCFKNTHWVADTTDEK